MYSKFSKLILPIVIVTFYLLVFHGWLEMGILSGGDWPYLYKHAVGEVVPLSGWDVMFNYGLGQSALPRLWFDAYSMTLLKVAQVVPWQLFERIFWFFPYLIVSFASSYFLGRKVGLSSNFSLISGLIYSINSYILMVVSGGQGGVFMAYAFLPAVFYSLLHLFENFNLKRSLILSLALSILVMLDLRVAYIYITAQVLISFIFLIFNAQRLFKKLLFLFIIPAAVAFLAHFFWILPILALRQNPTAEFTDIYTSASALSFFSFAKMENAIAFLHPNWPENLFGKVSFLKPEFLLVPILVFTSLLFVEREERIRKLKILSFVLIGIVGIFLAKGTNDPFGEVYKFLFTTIPGFVMFRDPTKWYMLIALSFSILIPYSLSKISEILSTKKIKYAQLIVCLFFIVFWGILLREAVAGNVGGTLRPTQIPSGFVSLAEKISDDKDFYRTFWIPTYTTLSYVSNTHPAVPAVEFFQATSTAELIKKLNNPESEEILKNAGVKYVVVPEDFYGKIFLTDRKYDEKVYKKTLNEVSKIKYLKQVSNYGKTGVFEVQDPKGHFWGVGENIKVSSKYISPVKYEVKVENAKLGDVLVFTDTFDKLWQADISGKVIDSNEFNISPKVEFNSFVLPKSGSYTVIVTYKPQKLINLGLIVSVASLLVVLLLTVKLKDKK